MRLSANRSLHLFLDDVRHPGDVTWIDLPPLLWTVVRDFEAFVATVQEMGVPASVSFDHDLADEHYRALDGQVRRHVTGYDEFREKTGYHCAKWLVDHCMRHRLPLPDQVFVHTMNPVGRDKIAALIALARKHAP